MVVLLGLLSSLVLGSADFVGGLAARRAPATVVVVWSNAVGLIAALAVLLVVPAVCLTSDLGWGAAAGAAGSLGAVLLYRALATAAMSAVAPTAAVTAALVPVVAGCAAGESLSTSDGIGVIGALAALVLISRSSAVRIGAAGRRGIAYAVGAGASFGAFLVLLAQATPGSGLWPLVAARSTALVLLLGLARLRGDRVGSNPGGRLALLAGLLDMTANVLFLAALRGGQLAVVGLLASLSPLGTVLLARFVLRERVHPVQRIGAAIAMGSVALLSTR